MAKRTHYLATDLEIEGDTDLTPMVAFFGDDVSVHFCGQVGATYRAAFGLAGIAIHAEEAIELYCALVNGLPDDLRATWDRLARVDFDIGYQAGDDPKSWSTRVSRESLRRVAAVGGDVVVTIYASSIDIGEGESG